MSNIELLILSIALGTDLFSVAIPIGMKPMRFRLVFRAACTFAVFHIVLILAGYYMGHFLGLMVEQVGSYNSDCPAMVMENWANIIGATVLAGLGIYMIKGNLDHSVGKTKIDHPLRGFSLLLLATSVSVDALAAGFSMGMMDVDLVRLSFILGTVILMIGLVGLGLGHRLGQYIGKRAELVGGIVLISLGLHVLWSTLY